MSFKRKVHINNESGGHDLVIYFSRFEEK